MNNKFQEWGVEAREISQEAIVMVLVRKAVAQIRVVAVAWQERMDFIYRIELVEIANGRHGEKRKIEGVNWNFIEQIYNEAISEIKQTGGKTGFVLFGWRGAVIQPLIRVLKNQVDMIIDYNERLVYCCVHLYNVQLSLQFSEQLNSHHNKDLIYLQVLLIYKIFKFVRWPASHS